MSVESIGSLATTGVLLIVGVVAGIGYFRKERDRGASDALATASDEITILKGKVQRLEEEAIQSRQQSARDQERIQILSDLVTGGGAISDQIQALIQAEITVVVAAITEGKRDILDAINAQKTPAA